MIEPGRRIRRAAVLGAGVMGSQLAAHFANAGIEVLLFEQAVDDADPRAGARRAIDGLARLHPSPLGAAEQRQAIEPATYDSDLERLQTCDVVIEAVVERLDIKQALLERVGPYIGNHAIVASDTSGLSIATLAKSLPEPLRARFCGVHFFNPPRYMHLVELISHPRTDRAVLHRLEGFLTTGMGKGVLHAHDTPGFIGNRIGMFSLAVAVHHAERLGIPADLADRLTGVGVGRQKSGTFRTIDVIGLDTFVHILDHLHAELDEDPWRDVFRVPGWLRERLAAGALGQKRRLGIYRKGETGIEVFEPEKGDYRPVARQLEPRVREALVETDSTRKLEMLNAVDHPQAEFIRACHRDLYHYCAWHLAALAPSAREVDLAMRWGYGWLRGPFEQWQMLGWSRVTGELQSAIDAGMTLADAPLPAWARESRRDGVHGPRGSWSPSANAPVPRSTHSVYRRQLFPRGLAGEPAPRTPTLWQSEAVRLWDAGDDIAVLSMRRPQHTVDGAVLDGMLHAIDLAEQEVRGLVLWGQDPPFSLGIDLGVLCAAQAAGDLNEIESLVDRFQQVGLALRHTPLPIVAAPLGQTLGGGLELALHCDARVAAFETYAGLIETAVGLVPVGGACARLARRAWRQAADGNPVPWLARYFEEIMAARVTGSALEGPWFGPGDRVVFHPDELLYAAKSEAMALADAGYRRPLPGKRFPVAGAAGVRVLLERLWALDAETPLSDHDRLVGEHLALALCGGRVDAGTEVRDQDILDIGRAGFMALVQTEAAAERVRHMLGTGRRLRN